MDPSAFGGQAYLFHGPRGAGIRAFALEAAGRLLSATIAVERNPDCMLLEPGIDEDTGKRSDIPVKVIHEILRPWIHTKPLYGAHKVAVIDDAERLSDEAANTLLKVLEEPPAYMHFFLVTSQLRAVLPTVYSRCQPVAFTGLAKEKMSVEANDAIASLRKVMTGGMSARINLAKTVAAYDDPASVAGWWLDYVYSRLGEKPQLATMAKGLLELHETLSDTRFNRRLALEKFLLSIPFTSDKFVVR